jgi:hypothetical protein
MSPKKHGMQELRGQKRAARSSQHEGRFGRLFGKLDPAPELSDKELRALAKKMREPAPKKGPKKGKGPQRDNPAIPAGYTYFGQFVDHDITFDPVSSLQRQNDPDALVDFRNPRFDLDSLYGSGPDDEPFRFQDDGIRFLIDPKNKEGEVDLPRNENGIALIGDKRNDENTIVSQLHLTFLRFHNKVAAKVTADKTVPAERRFLVTQRLVRWHYQWVILRNFLPRIVGQELVDSLVEEKGGKFDFNLRFYKPKKALFMPVEFSVAAYRYGHSQIRPTYHLNSVVRNRPIFVPGEKGSPLRDLRGFRPIPGAWTINWSFFLETDKKGKNVQLSRKIDSKLAPGLFDLPGFDDAESSLAFRNLKRGQALGLPSGQDVAKKIGAKPVLHAKELSAPEPTPLWFYVLKESELEGGRRLGQVGGRIVAEVLLGLLEGDARSFVNAQPDWRPTLGPKVGQFTLADLVKFATS